MNKKITLLILLLATMLVVLAGCVQTEEISTLEDTKMKTVTIDFSNCKYVYDLYRTVIETMEFPEWCSENLSAIQDMLKGEEETTVYFKGIDKLNEELQQEALEIFEIFVKAEKDEGKIHPLID